VSDSALLFAQLTDLHVGGRGLNAVEADANLRWALAELGALEPRPACALLTADLVCGGTREELRQCTALLQDATVPWHALPANHDLWGEDDASAWEELIGPCRHSVDLPGLRVVLWDDVQRKGDATWWAHAPDETLCWLDAELSSASVPCIVAHHVPMLALGDGFHDQWSGSNAPAVLEVLGKHDVIALITGHWHRNGEWQVGGMRVINTGALAGWNWTGTPPHYCFPTRPGYRLFCLDGQLRTLWREGSYWDAPAPACQVTLEWVGAAHTGGPRPQVHPVEVSGRCCVRVTAYSPNSDIASVEWSTAQGQWEPMTPLWQGVWSEWEAVLDPGAVRPAGELVCCVRARSSAGAQAYDHVPVRFGQRDSSAKVSAVSYPLAERLFELFYCPE